MDLKSYGTNMVIVDIITSLGWTKLCMKQEEGALLLVRELNANLEEKVEDKVFVRGK